MIIMYCCTKRMRKFSIANMMTSDWGRFKGPPSASEWSFGSTGKSNAAQGGDMLTVSPGGIEPWPNCL